MFSRIPFLISCLLAVFFTHVHGFTNPIKTPNGSDPFMVYNGGYYYLMTTTWTNIQITRGTNMQNLKTATAKVIWTDTTASRCCNMWAPEIHWKSVESAWYMYVSSSTRDSILQHINLVFYDSYYVAGVSANSGSQRVYALKGSSTDIWASTWSYAGEINPTGFTAWMIDPTVLLYGGKEYLVFSAFSGADQCLWIALMPTALTAGAPVLISCPSQSWEEIGDFPVMEGPAPLYYGGKTWIIYSASYCWTPSYSLGRLELTGTNPLSASSWTKYTPGPVFGPSANGLYGTGHNGFFLSPSGNQIWLVYHFTLNSAGACDGTRETAVQQITFSGGEPVFGTPDALTVQLIEPV
ncbi:hypothetical protein FRB94_001463 [Tulasnella sp. JGI-2019a]|nr:hypothetical protein FRB93_003659 [Tulasnella sp. JGI-2019a]KAG9005536.1 hypothetical protein FRB94_001463 [Tulasnella sp. JGI-2019a]KAG9032502.1 hypothetical protein FRB95_001409 [Tulasnella sp. JGI-2019a]